MVKMSQVKKSTIGGNGTSPKNGARPGHKKGKTVTMPGTLRKQKLARSSMPNLKGAETFPEMADGSGMNDENKLRKIRRTQQGL